MVDVGAEYEAAPIPSLSFTPMAKEAGFLVFLEYSGLAASLVYTDTSTREIDPSAMVMQEPPGVGDEGDPVFWPSVGETVLPEYLRRYISEKTSIRVMGRTRDGKTSLFEGMFNSRDKLARIGVVCTITGVPLGNTDVILNGINHREIVKTDERGVWWRYLEIDEYPGALFVSPNGITYDLLSQTERLPDNEGIFDQVVRRRTLANATSRQFHRKFV